MNGVEHFYREEPSIRFELQSGDLLLLLYPRDLLEPLAFAHGLIRIPYTVLYRFRVLRTQGGFRAFARFKQAAVSIIHGCHTLLALFYLIGDTNYRAGYVVQFSEKWFTISFVNKYGSQVPTGDRVGISGDFVKNSMTGTNRMNRWIGSDTADKSSGKNRAVFLFLLVAALMVVMAGCQKESYIERGDAYMNLGKTDEAIIEYSKAIESGSDDAALYYKRGVLYRLQGNNREAVDDLSMTISLEPENAEAYCERAIAYGNLAQMEPALSDLDKAIEIDPKFAKAYSNRSAAYLSIGDYDNAISDASTAIGLEPRQPEHYVNRGWAYFHTYYFESALKDLNRAIELDPTLAIAYCDRGWVHFTKMKYDEAIADFEKVLTLTDDPNLVAAAKQGIRDAQEN